MLNVTDCLEHKNVLIKYKDPLYLFHTQAKMSKYTNNKQMYTITQHSSSKNNTFLQVKKGVKRLKLVYINKTKYYFEKFSSVFPSHCHSEDVRSIQNMDSASH